MADDGFGHPRLAAIYDPLDPDRSDLDAYLRMAEEFEARQDLDIGCGAGVFALLLADRGIDVIGIDPAQPSIDVARAKPGSERVRWICGDATALPPLQVDLATTTANVAQEIADPVSRPLVTFRWTHVFGADGQVLTSDSTLRFRERDEVETDLVAHGYELQGVRDAPDRPGNEFVFLARRPG
ncbi:hypothetical protein AQJ30_04065 [Streptomyces longwoodensis]|uniref:Methyltransferase domain-containing protein n=1 Tax=Streptomyces longwoodensis TaxID=68231 RepID=A0A117QQE7_9ACTN|nr:class I SAM-dependent methyltransferase [Streptomyces longwoodensis]KUN41066.1 hypothetical protein AQJ30_04065 [Streptomyces longwoodensis]